MEQNKPLTLGSLFDGSGGFPLGGIISGIAPIWSAEIEPFPIRVTTKCMPFVKHYGDVSGLNGAELESVDMITFGSPCQDMSIAGKRSGLSGSRSNLFYEAVRIVKEMREKTNGKYPRFIVWENVPGAFSSNGGEDFRCVLEQICKIRDGFVSIPEFEKWKSAGEIVGDGYSVAWRVLDAQFWGVPQRRKRIYLVADFDSECAGKILFESEGVSGYSEQSLCPRKEASADSGAGPALSGRICMCDQGGQRIDILNEKTSTLRAESHHPPCILERLETVPAAVYENHSQDTRYTELENIAPTVSATYGAGGNNQPFVVEAPQAYGICSKGSNSMKSDNPRSGFYSAETSRTIDCSGGDPSCNQGGIAIVETPKTFDVRFTSEGTKNARQNCYETETSRTIDTGGNSPDSNQGGVAVVCVDQGGKSAVCVQGSMIGRKDKNGPQGSGINEDVSFTLNAADRHVVAFSQEAYDKYAENQKCGSLRASGGVYGGGSEALVYSTSKASYHTAAEENLANTLVATDYKDPPVVNDFSERRYIVRRLTPTECARLQGFPDWWCGNLNTDDPTDEDISFWRKVFEEHRKVMGTSSKPRSDKQIEKWLKNPYSDSAEYKMWGNGVALPCVVFVLSGIVWLSSSE